MSQSDPKKRRRAWHPATIAGALHPGNRPGDPDVRWKVATVKATAKWTAAGVAMWFAGKSMTMVGGMLAAQTATIQELPKAVAQAIKERDALDLGDAAWVVGEVQALRAETREHQAADAVEFAQLRGVVSGRLKCPPCPGCPACPPVIVQPAPTQPGTSAGGSRRP